MIIGVLLAVLSFIGNRIVVFIKIRFEESDFTAAAAAAENRD